MEEYNGISFIPPEGGEALLTGESALRNRDAQQYILKDDPDFPVRIVLQNLPYRGEHEDPLEDLRQTEAGLSEQLLAMGAITSYEMGDAFTMPAQGEPIPAMVQKVVVNKPPNNEVVSRNQIALIHDKYDAVTSFTLYAYEDDNLADYLNAFEALVGSIRVRTGCLTAHLMREAEPLPSESSFATKDGAHLFSNFTPPTYTEEETKEEVRHPFVRMGFTLLKERDGVQDPSISAYGPGGVTLWLEEQPQYFSVSLFRPELVPGEKKDFDFYLPYIGDGRYYLSVLSWEEQRMQTHIYYVDFAKPTGESSPS